MKRIKAVQSFPGYKLKLHFDDGVSGVVDLSAEVEKPIFAAWKNFERFASVRIAHGGRSLEWSEGVDLCADALYLEITGLKVENLFAECRRETTHA